SQNRFQLPHCHGGTGQLRRTQKRFSRADHFHVIFPYLFYLIIRCTLYCELLMMDRSGHEETREIYSFSSRSKVPSLPVDIPVLIVASVCLADGCASLSAGKNLLVSRRLAAQ